MDFIVRAIFLGAVGSVLFFTWIVFNFEEVWNDFPLWMKIMCIIWGVICLLGNMFGGNSK